MNKKDFLILIMGDVMKKTYFTLLTILVLIVLCRYSYIYFYKHEYYYESYLKMTNKLVYGLNAPRGRIMDRNGKILVDNVGINTIEDILENVEEASLEEQKNYYLKFNDTDNLLTKDEQELFKHRKLTSKEVEEIKLNRVEDFLKYEEEEKKVIHLYYLLNKGYSYDSKIIESDVNDAICAKVNSLNIDGLT